MRRKNRQHGLIRRDISSFLVMYKSYKRGKPEKKEELLRRLDKLESMAKLNNVYDYYQEEFERQRSRVGVVINFDD